MPFVTSSFLLPVVRPGAPSIVLAPSSKAVCQEHHPWHAVFGDDLRQEVTSRDRQRITCVISGAIGDCFLCFLPQRKD